jgi:hypothetical protein
MTQPSDIGQVNSGIFNSLLVVPHFNNITLAPISSAPKEGGLVFDENTQLLYYSRQYRWVPIMTGGIFPNFPQGIIVQITSPSGSNFTGVTIDSVSPEIVVTNGNGVGGYPTLTFHPELLPPPSYPVGMLAQITSPTGTNVVGRTITSISSAIIVTNGDGVSGNPTLNFNPSSLPLPTLPQGIISQQTGPSGTTYNGVVLTSSQADLLITNGNGVGGNPTISYNLTNGIVGSTLPAGPDLQPMINYLSTIFNVNNGMHVWNGNGAIIPPSSSIIVSLATIGFAWTTPTIGYYNTDPNFNATTGLYTGDGSRYHISLTVTYAPTAVLGTSPFTMSVFDTIAATKIDQNTNRYELPSVPENQVNTSLITRSFSFDAPIISGHTIGIQVITLGAVSVMFNDISWSLRKIM